MINNFKKFFFYYLSLLFIFCFIYLVKKHDVGNDSTISEWIINYSGGFTKRGIIGEICILIANTFKEDLLLQGAFSIEQAVNIKLDPDMKL